MTVTYTTTPFLPGVVTGWLIDSDYQYEFGGLLFGHNSPFMVAGVNGLLGQDSSANSQRHTSSAGSQSGHMTLNQKFIDFSLELSDQAAGMDIDDLVRQLQAAFQPPPLEFNSWAGDYAVHGNIPLHGHAQLAYRRPGGPTKVIYCRCKRLSIPSNYKLAHGRATVEVQLEADDPVSYSMFPTIYKATMGSADLVAEMEVTNAGNYLDGYQPMITVASASLPAGFKNPVVKRLAPSPFDPEVELTQAISVFAEFPTAGDPGIAGFLGLDAKYRVTQPLTISQYMVAAEWWRIMPGVQTVRFERAAWAENGPIVVRVISRDAWVS